MKNEIQIFLEWKATHTKKAPQSDGAVLKKFDKFFQKKMLSIENISITNIREYQLFCEEKFSPNNIAYHIYVIKAFFDFWRKRRNIQIYENDIRVPKFIMTKRKVIKEEDYLKIINSFNELKFIELRNKIIIKLLWETGMRVSEITDINILDIDNDSISYATITTKKNRQTRWVAWSSDTTKLLKNYLGVRLCINQRPELFISYQTKKRLTTRAVQHMLNDTCEKIGIKKYNPHSFRHAKAHRILESGGSVKDIQQILGHSEKNPVASFMYLRLDHREGLRIAKKYV